MSSLPEGALRLNSAVCSVQVSSHPGDDDHRFLVKTSGGKIELYDHVIFACHSDTALETLHIPEMNEERRILGVFKWNRNEVVLHSDTKVRSIEKSPFVDPFG